MTKVLDAVMKGLGQILRAMLVITVALICLQIFSRYVLGKPLTWTEQLCRFFFIWMMMLEIPVLFHEKEFMAFDLLLHAIPGKTQQVVSILIKIGICAFAVFWLVGSVKLCMGTMNKLTSGVRIHYYWLYGAQSLSALLILWVMVTQTVQDVLQLVRGGSKEEGGDSK